MKLEKRSAGMPEEQPAQDPAVQSGGQKQKNKPVLVYILILFIVAFLLMALSLLMHQRSNAEVIGKLSDSVTTLQKVQELQDENLQLQNELISVQKENDAITANAQDVLDRKDHELRAMNLLYVLQQQYANQDYEACEQTLQDLEANSEWEYLPEEAATDLTPPFQCWRQIKEAVLAHE